MVVPPTMKTEICLHITIQTNIINGSKSKDTGATVYYVSSEDYTYNVLEMIACLLVPISWLTLCTHVAQWLPSPCLCAA